VQMPAAAVGTERQRFHVNPIPPADLQENSVPMPAMGTTAPVGGTPAGATPGETMTNPPAGR